MQDKSNPRLWPEVAALQNLVASARRASPATWDAVAAAINATDAAVMSNITTSEPPTTRITSAGETATATRMEEQHG